MERIRIEVLLAILLSIASLAQTKNHMGNVLEVREVSTKTGAPMIEGEYNGNKIELECFASHSDCIAPELGSYLLVMLPSRKGAYMDCRHNIELYSINKLGKADKKIGQYCANMGD